MTTASRPIPTRPPRHGPPDTTDPEARPAASKHADAWHADARHADARHAATEARAGIGHVVLRLDDGSLDASPNCAAILGRATLAGLTAQSFPGLFLAEDRATLTAAIRRALRDGTPCDVTLRRDPRAGARRHIRLRGQLERDGVGHPAALLCVIEDRTDMLRQERQLEQAQRLQAFGQLAGGVAHEFNNLLTVIMGNAELLRDAAADRLTAEDRMLVDEALVAVERGRTLTDSLTSFARVAPLRPEPQRLDRLRDAVAGVLRRTLPATIVLHFEAQADGWPVFADSGTLQHVLFNLALNARDAMPKGGTLRITARNHRLDAPLGPLWPGPYVAIAVADPGAGIAPDHLPRFCEPFFTTKPVGQGSGLGLSRVKGFVEQSGGALRIDSTPEFASRRRHARDAAAAGPRDRRRSTRRAGRHAHAIHRPRRRARSAGRGHARHSPGDAPPAGARRLRRDRGARRRHRPAPLRQRRGVRPADDRSGNAGPSSGGRPR